MTRTFTGLCIASAFAFAASAAAQSGTATTAGQTSQASGHEVSVTGCLAKAGDGTYTLTNARVEPAGSASSSASTSTTTGSATTTAGSATGTTGSAATTSPSSGGSHAGAMSNDTTWTLQGGRDLDKHVGHKIQVTGNATWSSSEHSSNGFSSTGAATASTGSTTASGAAGTTAATTGTTAGTSGSVTGGEQRSTSPSSTASAGNGHPRLDVQSVKMVASSCS